MRILLFDFIIFIIIIIINYTSTPVYSPLSNAICSLHTFKALNIKIQRQLQLFAAVFI